MRGLAWPLLSAVVPPEEPEAKGLRGSEDTGFFSSLPFLCMLSPKESGSPLWAPDLHLSLILAGPLLLSGQKRPLLATLNC